MATFKEKTIEALLRKKISLKLSEATVKVTGELLRIYCLEILSRAADQAIKEGAQTVTTEHLEKVLAQFLLDFN